MHQVPGIQRISYRKCPYECSEAATLKFPKLPHTPKLGKLSSKLSWVRDVRDRNLTEGRIYPKAEFTEFLTEFRISEVCSEVWIEHTT